MLLPSSIQRADDFVGMAMPTVPLLWANAVPLVAAAARPATASARIVVFSLSMLHSLCVALIEAWIFNDATKNFVWWVTSRTCEPHIRLGTAARGCLQQEGAAMIGIGGARRVVHVLPGR